LQVREQAAAEAAIGADMPVSINPLMQLVHDDNWVAAAEMIYFMEEKKHFEELQQLIMTRSPNLGDCNRRQPKYKSPNSTLMHMMAHHKPSDRASDHEKEAYDYAWERVGLSMRNVPEIDVRQGFDAYGKTPLMAAAAQNNIVAMIHLLMNGASGFRRVLGLLSD
jgi:hypothetical protein